MTLMAAEGAFGRLPDVAIYADTGWDPPEVRRNVEWLAQHCAPKFPIEIVTAGNLRADLLAGRNSRGTGKPGFNAIPMFTRDRATGTKGMSKRQCSNEYKIQPITKRLRELAGLKPRQRARTAERDVRIEQWLGISIDEIHRAKQPKENYLNFRFPLIDANLARQDCADWWAANAPAGAPDLVRSACLGCPYKSANEWAQVAAIPDRLDDVAEVEQAIQAHAERNASSRTQDRFLHVRRIPIREALAADAAEAAATPGLFGNECEGFCGV